MMQPVPYSEFLKLTRRVKKLESLITNDSPHVIIHQLRRDTEKLHTQLQHTRETENLVASSLERYYFDYLELSDICHRIVEAHRLSLNFDAVISDLEEHFGRENRSDPNEREEGSA